MESWEEISEHSYLLNHAQSVEKIYNHNFMNENIKKASFNKTLFNINVPYDHREETKNDENRSAKKRKRMKTIGTFDEITQRVFENHSSVQHKLKRNANQLNTNNKQALEFVDQFNSSTNYDGEKRFRGQNTTDCTIVTEMDGEQYLIPPRVSFINSSVDRFAEYIEQNETFDLIVLDPPWWNKYIRRVKAVNSKASYRMLTNEDIKAIPLERHLHQNTLVVVWCTNAPSHIEAVSTDFFSKWGVELVACWYWIKITTSGAPVCKFNEPHQKQPYERIFIGLPADSAMAKTFPRERFLYSVPSAIHSHKPPLHDLFTSKYLPQQATCLELFARSLYSGCTSYGMEVLKLQNKRLYELAIEDED
ncbi:N(6)-adenine-specific methyltransferase METTL4 [Anopheles marshallii]|uniref:N(6)-adenine-specific methyltransferase METTL4 n=1 Tax=Anopheles marshallii TaxID=1521116 RepID=UPI00237C4E9C|nr:N(6)-adenine-specific methyltransferase METTL4 [Anopheles marshallii]